MGLIVGIVVGFFIVGFFALLALSLCKAASNSDDCLKKEVNEWTN